MLKPTWITMAQYRVVHNTFCNQFTPQIRRWWWPFWVALYTGTESCGVTCDATWPTREEAARECRLHAFPPPQPPQLIVYPVTVFPVTSTTSSHSEKATQKENDVPHRP